MSVSGSRQLRVAVHVMFVRHLTTFVFCRSRSQCFNSRRVLSYSVDQSPDIVQTNVTDQIEGVAIMVAVVIVVLVTALNDFSKEKQFRGLQETVNRQHSFFVLRDAQTTQLAVADIVVGDICVIKYGNTHRRRDSTVELRRRCDRY